MCSTMLKDLFVFSTVFITKFLQFQFSSVIQSCPTLCDPVDCSTPGLPVHHQLSDILKRMSIKSVMPSSHLILCRPFLLPPSIFFIFPSIKVFSNESVLCIKWPKYWEFQLQHPEDSQESSPTPQFKSINSLALSFLYSPQLSHPYMTTGKTIALTRRTFVGKVMSLLFNMLSRLVIAFLPRNKCLLISWLQSPSAVILEPKKLV